MPMNEAETRKKYIDESLRRSGWNNIVLFKEGASYKDEAVEEYSTSSGPADYVLFCNGQPVAIVEGQGQIHSVKRRRKAAKERDCKG